MAFLLPKTLFTSHRLVEESEFVYRLSDQYRAALLHGSDAPLPTNLPHTDTHPLQAVQTLEHNLTGIYGHFIRLDDTERLLLALIEHLYGMIERSADGCIASILLSPYGLYTPRHAINCALLATRMADQLQLNAEEKSCLVGAALTMNIGSAEVQNALAGQDGPPSTLQRQTLDIHPLLSSALLREANIFQEMWHSNVIFHHERKDGRGYAFGAKGQDITPLAQLLHLIDVVTAKIMPRAYRGRITAKAALASLYAGTEESFDAHYITQLVKILGIYPPGSFVELESGARALVIQSGKNAAAPIVAPIKSPREMLDTSLPGYHVKTSVTMRIEQKHLPLLHQYWS